MLAWALGTYVLTVCTTRSRMLTRERWSSMPLQGHRPGVWVQYAIYGGASVARTSMTEMTTMTSRTT